VKEPQTLSGPRATLVPFREEHICQAYVDWLNDPEVNRYLEVRLTPQSLDSVCGYVESFYGEEEKYLWGIYPTGEAAPIGTCSLYHLSRYHGSVEFGIMIGDKAHWGKRLGGETLNLLLEYTFQTLGLRRLVAGSYAKNVRMNAAVRRLGFVCDATLRQACRVGDDEYSDEFRWVMFAADWRRRQEGEGG